MSPKDLSRRSDLKAALPPRWEGALTDGANGEGRHREPQQSAPASLAEAS